ncbi:hypothetical protein E4U31_007961, partial [Claviceps sp. LM219 group G6]
SERDLAKRKQPGRWRPKQRRLSRETSATTKVESAAKMQHARTKTETYFLTCDWAAAYYLCIAR